MKEIKIWVIKIPEREIEPERGKDGLNENNDIAVFWDYENVRVVAEGANVPLAESLVEYSKNVGHLRVQKAYSNWRTVSDVIVKALYSLGFEPIQVSMGKPNSVDVKLTVDCLEVALTIPSVKTFIIITSDKDYIPLANLLKKYKKRVIIIGKSDIVSEHLLLSADEFVSFEELSKMYELNGFSEISKTEMVPIDFEEANKCLYEAIKAARDQGKTTRFALIDNLMRSSPNYNYLGAKHIKKPDDSGTFRSFGEFISEVEANNEIKSVTIEGFKEIFLPEEDPDLESEFSPQLPSEIDEKDWKIIFGVFEKTLEEKIGLNFGELHAILRKLKKEGQLNYSNRVLRNAVKELIEGGLLEQQPDKTLILTDKFEEKSKSFLEKNKERSFYGSEALLKSIRFEQ